ncbi:hypothetical protein [Shewanella fidelis]|uniref:DUF4402 domain-containing protein n=1 Tax=Shewanella fidelis TaxID=173509 RepID=A0AAW8NQ41_9GAMM|nr:hypothetical protein [Shewanella fidelis]MDR8524019.1 hypothetical protein [Shewanella fidelis]MDW4810566.1 hypothetical protein [Shewanella fidelis]MDW4814687.1 hypothetical protein [Shewanella fidelis]MDW4818777.1 hypothetical protein [Shewanella fidelis]MDW4823546.1 hypothetical protein [Shewanella fidelis]
MTNKILLSTLVASSLLLSTGAIAADATGTANFNLVYPLTVTETTAMEFGDVSIAANASCAVDFAGATTGSACVAGGATSAAGAFTVSGANGLVNVSVSGADTSIPGVEFTPSVANASETIAGNTASINVAGNLAITAANATAGTHALSYTLSVTY